MQGNRPAGLPGIMASVLLAAGCSGTPATHPRDAGTLAAPTTTEPRAAVNDLRRSIAEPVVRTRMIRSGGGSYEYLRLYGFPASAATRVRRLAQQAVNRHADGLILDLRGNPGGLLSQAVA